MPTVLLYYRKPMSNWILMPENSALAMSVKRTSLTQYGLRILRNTKLEVPWSEKAAMLSEFAARLRDSGYNEKFRKQIIQSILGGWDKMLAEHEAGRRPINRSRNWQSEKRRQEKVRKKSNWYKTGGYSTVIFCPYTPGGELAKKWREIEAREADTRGWRYKVVESSGRQVRSIVCKNPWAGTCNDQECFVCTTGGSGNCKQPGCTYKIQCMACKGTFQKLLSGFSLFPCSPPTPLTENHFAKKPLAEKGGSPPTLRKSAENFRKNMGQKGLK